MMAATWQQGPPGPTSHQHHHNHHPSSNTVVVAPNTNLHAANNTPTQGGAAPGEGAVLLSPQGSATEDDPGDVVAVSTTPGTGKLSLQDEKQIALSQLEELENAIATRKVTKIDGRKTRWKEYHEQKQKQQELTGIPVNKRRSRKKTPSGTADENNENEAVVNNNNINKSPVNNKAADTAAVSMKMDVLNTSNSNHSHAGASPLASVETNNVLESMKQQFLQGTENVPENVINGKLGIDEKDRNKRNSRSRRGAGKSPKGSKKVGKDEITTQVIIPQVGSPVKAKAPETPTPPITPVDTLTPVAVIQRKFFPPQGNSLTKGLRGIRKTGDTSPTKSDARSPIASPLLPPVVSPFSLPILNSTESPTEPVAPSLTPISAVSTPKITRTSIPRGATKDAPKNAQFSLLDDAMESPAVPVAPEVPTPLVGENNQEESKLVADVIEKSNLATKMTPKITRGSAPRVVSKDGPKNKDSKLSNGSVSENINETPKSSKETAKIISKDLKPNLREIKLLGKEITKITRETTRSVSRENLTRSSSKDNLTRSTSRENLTRSLPKENLRSTPRESLSRSTSKENLRNTEKERENLTRSLSRENLIRSTSRESLSRSTSKENLRSTDKDIPLDSTPKFVSRKLTPKFVSKKGAPKDTPKFVSTEVLQKQTPKSATKVLSFKDTLQLGSKDLPSLGTQKSVSKDENSLSVSKEVYPKEDPKSVKEASLQETTKSVPKEVTEKIVKKTISKDDSLIGTIKSASKNLTPKDTQKILLKDSPKFSTKIIQKNSLKSSTKTNLRNAQPLTKSSSKIETLTNSKLKGPMRALFRNKPPTLKVGTQKIGAPKSTLKSKKHGIGKSIIRSLKKSLRKSAVNKELKSINEQIENKDLIIKKAGEKKRRNSEKVLLKKVEVSAPEKNLEKIAEKESGSLDSTKKIIEDGSIAVKKSAIKTNEKASLKILEKKTTIPQIANPNLDESIRLASDIWESEQEGRRTTRGRPAKRKAEIEIEAQQNLGKSSAKAITAVSHEGKMTGTFIVDVHNSMSGEPQITLASVQGVQVGKKRRVVSPAKPSTNSDVPILKDLPSTRSSSASNTKILPVRTTRDRSTKNSEATDNTKASVPGLELTNSSNDLQHDIKHSVLSINNDSSEIIVVGKRLITSKTSPQTLVTQTITPKSGSMKKLKSITPIFVPRHSPKTPPITPVAISNTSKTINISNTSEIENIAPKPSTSPPQIVPIVETTPNVPIVSKESPVSNVPNVSVASSITPIITTASSIISTVKPIVSSLSNSSMVTSHSTSDSVTTTTSIITSTVVTSQASTVKGKPITFVPISISPSLPQNTITIAKSDSQKDVNDTVILSPPNKTLVKKAISLEDISQLHTVSIKKSPSLKDLSKHSNTLTEKTNLKIPSTSASNVSSSINKSSPRKKPNLLTIADTLMAKKLPEGLKSNVQNPVLGMSLSKEKSAVDEIKEKAAFAKKELGSNKTPARKTVTNIVDQEKRTSSPSPSMPSLEKVTIVNLESSPVDRMPSLDRMKDSPLRELSITPLPKQIFDESAKATKSNSRPTVETHTLTVSVAKAPSISPDSESSKSPKKKVPRVLKQLYQDEGVQNMLNSLGEGGTTEKESEETGPHKLRPKKPTDPNIGAILDSDIDELILMHNQQTMMNKKKKRSNEVDSLHKDEGILNLLTNLETSSKKIGQFDDSESDISSTSGKSARQAKTITTEISVTDTRKRRLSGASSVSNASSGSMKPPDTKKAKHVGQEASEFNDTEEIEELSTSNKEEIAQKRGRGRPSLPEHVKQKNKAMRMQLQLQKEGRDVTVSRLDENGSANTIPQIEFIRLPNDNSKSTVDSGNSPNIQGSQYIPPIKIRLPSGETSFTPPQQGSTTGSLQGVSRSVTITPINSNNSGSRTVSPAPQQQSKVDMNTINNKAQQNGSKVPPQLVRRSGSPDKLQQQMPQGKRVEIAASPTAASFANLVNSLIPGMPVPGKKKEGGESLRQSQRASVRQSEGNYRYRDIALRKFNNFVQIILTPSTTKMKNSLNTRVLRELVEALNTLKRDDTVRLVLFTSTGSTFCQGIDLTSLMHNNQETRRKNAENLVKGIKEFLKALVSFHKPIVAGVNGNAMGLGVTMLPLFDLVIATDKAEFFLPYSKLGQVPEGGATYTFPSILGKLQSTRLFMGHKVSAAEACSMGLASESIWPATFQRELLPKVALIAQNSSQSMEATKALMNHHLITKLELSLESECRLLLQHWLTPQFTMLCKRFLDSQLGNLCMQKPVNLPL